MIFAHPFDNHDNARAAADRSSDGQPGGGAGVDDVDLWLGAAAITTPAFVYEQTMTRESVEPGLCAAYRLRRSRASRSGRWRACCNCRENEQARVGKLQLAELPRLRQLPTRHRKQPPTLLMYNPYRTTPGTSLAHRLTSTLVPL